jgi:polysaccharide pyruvyl transferase WcaK-like protein
MKIGISSYAGYGNFGDDIFFRTWQQIFSDHEVVQLSGYENIGKLDRVIIGGGDLIVPFFFSNAYWRPSFFEVPTYIYGASVCSEQGALKSEMAKYTAFMAKCKEVNVRDAWSRNFIIENGIHADPHVVDDIAWAYRVPSFEFYKGIKSRKTVGVSIRAAYGTWDNDVILDFLCDISPEFDIMLIPLQPSPIKFFGETDYELHEKLKANILSRVPDARVHIVPMAMNLDHRIKFIEQCDIYVTERMHGMLMSLRVGTPVIPVAEGNKFTRIMEKFNVQDLITPGRSVKELHAKFEMAQEIVVSPYAVRQIEDKAMTQILEFKKRVLS